MTTARAQWYCSNRRGGGEEERWWRHEGIKPNLCLEYLLLTLEGTTDTRMSCVMDWRHTRREACMEIQTAQGEACCGSKPMGWINSWEATTGWV